MMHNYTILLLSACACLRCAKILLWRHAVFFFESTEKAVIAAEPDLLVNLCDGIPLLDKAAAAIQLRLGDIGVERLPCLALELTGDMLMRNKKVLFQLFQCDFLIQMRLNVKEHIVQHQVVAADLRLVGFCLNTRAQYQNYEHFQDAIFKQ